MNSEKYLIASNDMMLTNGDIFAYEVWLGEEDSITNWHEISIAEVELIKKQNMPEIPNWLKGEVLDV